MPNMDETSFDKGAAELSKELGSVGALQNEEGEAPTPVMVNRELLSMDLDLLNLEDSPVSSPAQAKPRLRSLLKEAKCGGRNSTSAWRHEESSGNDSAELLPAKISSMPRQGVRFSEEVDTKDISRLGKSAIENLFYNSTDMADFRQEAFLEECGLDPSEFM